MADNAMPAGSFVGFKDYEIQRMQRDLDWMAGATPDDDIKADFYRFFAEHDRRHGVKFIDIFPEMSAFYDECKYHADERR